MRPHACIVLLIAAYAGAATIQIPAAEKKLPAIPIEPAKETNPLDNVSSEQELLDSANTIKDVENNLRVKAIDSIPVKVIVDPVDDDATDFKRVEVDLNDPGEPQRQEHDTQSPESFGHEQQIIATVKQTVSDTQYALKQGFQGVSQGLQDWITNNEQLGSIQESIQGLQQSFTSQITKLNDTIQSYWNNQGSPDAVQTDQKKKPQFDVENNLKNLENNFQISVKALSEGVQVFATLRDDNEKPTTPPNNLFLQYLQLFQQTLTQGFNNVTQVVQNYVQQNNTTNNASNGGIIQGINNGFQNIFNQGGSNPAPGAQSDEGAPQRPTTIWQGIQSTIQNVINPSQSQNTVGQNDQPVGPPNGPFAQAIQNNPFVQGIVSFIQPKPAAQQAQPAEQPAPQGSNVVPAPAETKPESDAQQPAKTPEQPAPAVLPNGPIKNLIQNNPIVQGITGAVQRFQSSINGNSDTPRDTVKEEKQPVKEEQQNVKEEQQVVKEELTETKGHGGSGDSSDSSGVATKAEPEKPVKVEEPTPEEPKKEIIEEKKVIKETEKTEAS